MIPMIAYGRLPRKIILIQHCKRWLICCAFVNYCICHSVAYGVFCWCYFHLFPSPVVSTLFISFESGIVAVVEAIGIITHELEVTCQPRDSQRRIIDWSLTLPNNWNWSHDPLTSSQELYQLNHVVQARVMKRGTLLQKSWRKWCPTTCSGHHIRDNHTFYATL